MQRVASLFLSILIHTAYFIILVQAFAIPPRAEYFGPCACTILTPKTETRLVVIGNLKPLRPHSLHLVSLKPKSDDKFCQRSKDTDVLEIGSDLTLGPRLEELISTQSEPVRVCMKLDGNGQVESAYAQSKALSLADERMISNFIADRWSFAPAQQHLSNSLAGTYALTLEVREEPVR